MIRIVCPFYSEIETVKPGLRSLRNHGFDFDFAPVQGPLVHVNINLGISGGFSDDISQEPLPGFSHFLIVNSDIGFEMEHVNAALQKKVSVCALPYLRHDEPSYQVGMLEKDTPLIDFHYALLTRGFKQVDFAGTGFLLIERSVFTILKYPWFYMSTFQKDSKAYNIGEDINFSNELRNRGLLMHCDFENPVYHKLRTVDDFDVKF